MLPMLLVNYDRIPAHDANLCAQAQDVCAQALL
jgi:hypothetical protein